ncbi:MAG: tRNA (5-methylaminomethyl-2-thiouridine)(34)-methyltransferase MnmD [Pseudomonadota bacterium]
MTHQQAQIAWTGDVPVSTAYDDPYYSLDDGVAEGNYVFLNGNDLPGRLTPGFHIAELGFGTGLNLILALRAARSAHALPLHYTGFELHPMTAEDMVKALSAFPEIQDDATWLVNAWAEGIDIQADDIKAKIILGDAAQTLPAWDGKADAWFLDGFAPARNPGLWSDALMAEVAGHTAAGGTVATYTAAGHVRRALDAAGFDVTRRPGFARKRHMTTGVLR